MSYDTIVYEKKGGWAAVRRGLLPTGVEMVRAWLRSPHSDTSLEGGAYCAILTRESDATLTCGRRKQRVNLKEVERFELPAA